MVAVFVCQVILPNENLISTNFDLIDEPTREDYYLSANYDKYYYDTVVKKSWSVNEDYTVISKELFSYFLQFYTWERPIIR